ncbi:hypothetical protein V8G54_004871 [Vigna mungo]|uniref:Uncharacterized protein n=1 Tax=Vigna mungo TaxID=3915 RepID=A0AAQ3SDE7_VIGMU
MLFTLSSTEAKDDNRLEFPFHYHLNNLVNVRTTRSIATSPTSSTAFPTSPPISQILLHKSIMQLQKIVLPELFILIYNQVQPTPSDGKRIVLQRRRPKISVHNVTRLLVDITNPLRKFRCIRHGCGEKHHLNRRRQKNYTLFPYNASFAILHVVNFIEYNPRHFFQDFGTSVEHTTENLGGHDETRGVR